MRSFYPSSLLDFLNTGVPFRRAQLLTLTLASGTVLRYAEWDYDIPVDSLGGTYSASGPLFKRSNVTHKRGLEVDSMTLSIYPRDTDFADGMAWGDLVLSGALDYGQVSLDFAIFDMTGPPGAFLGTFNWFSGVVSDIPSGSGLGYDINVKSELTRLDIMMPRNMIQPGCLNTLYDQQCTVDPAAFTATGTVLGINGDGSLQTSVSAANGYYNEGRLLFTSGSNANAMRKIKTSVGANLYLFSPPYFAPTGASISIRPGCAKTMDDCKNKFNNILNFRGIPFVPTPETVLS